MTAVLIAMLLLGGAHAAFGVVIFESSSMTIHMKDTVTVEFFADISAATTTSTINIFANSSNEGIVTVETPDSSTIKPGIWNSSIEVHGVFLGNADIVLYITIDDVVYSSESLSITVIREERVIDTVFTASVALLVSILYINFGCAMDWDVCRKTLKRPIGPVIGFLCQFAFMPVMSYGLAYLLFPDNAEMQLGIFFTGVSPSGGASNIWTVLLGGNLNLSVTMTTICTLTAFGMMPLWIFTLGAQIFSRGNLVIPYSRVAMFAFALVVPLAIGFFIQKKLPRVCRLMVRIMKPFSICLILFIIIFAIATNLYLFQLFSWRIIVAGMGQPWLGFIFGYVVSFILRQPPLDTRAIAIEAGIQNTGIAIFMLRFSLPQPAADLTTVAPVACAIMTPIPLTILYIIKLIVDRRKKKLRASTEKLQDNPQSVVAITSSGAPTRVTSFD
ncbi:P3 protein [Cephus cinctus]|uniref:P3 protein n=1 Tax=Cephus cinctus TaxID=211228 RepID=A0AAJ7C9I8_CEPCN|nr:P3 protein [Cephus cinctus]XP_015605101.1 P3 protein [Cephus cinctus]